MKVREQSRLKPANFYFLLLALVLVSVAASGCNTLDKEPENSSSRPWNSPEGYENGNLPSSIFH